jgi:thymidine kinase
MAGQSKTPKTEVKKVEKKVEEPGRLTLVCGPMYAGKTSHLIANYEKHKDHAIVINFCDDNRYSKTMLSSHDQLMIPCIKVRNLAEVEANVLEVVLFKDAIKTIFIDEGQFYSDLVPQVLKFLEVWNKDVFVYGLDSDFRRQRFGSLLELVPHADHVEKLKANCSRCFAKNCAMYSHRLTNEENIVLIGNSNYESLCRKCYIKSI